jgi:hypothetical protein
MIEKTPSDAASSMLKGEKREQCAVSLYVRPLPLYNLHQCW